MDDRKREAYVTWGIMLVNIIYFLFLDMTGSSESASYMLDHGAMYVPYVLAGEYYRLLTSVFMHFGISHLVNNMLVLFMLGDYLERALGRVRYLLFYLICGVGANLVSVVFYLYMKPGWGFSANAVSAGASGAIFGIAGGLLYIVIINRGRLEEFHTRQIGLMILFSLYLGFQSVETDNLAHIAGVLIGFVLAMVMYRKPRRP